MKKQIVLFVLFLPCFLFAQYSNKKVLTPDDFAAWKIIEGELISNNGKLVVYEVNPQRGDGNLIVQHLESKHTDTIPRGYDAKISPELNFVVFKIKQPLDSIRKAKLSKVEKDKMPKDSLGIYYFKSRKLYKFPGLKSFSIPEENANWLAFLAEPPKVEKKKTDNKDSDEEEEGEKESSEKNKKKDMLVLFRTKGADTIQYNRVKEYHYSKKGSRVSFIQELGDSIKSTRVSLFDTNSGDTSIVFDQTGYSKKITLDDEGNQYAFLFSTDTIKEKIYELKTGHVLTGLSQTTISKDSKGMPIGWAPSEFRKLLFSEDGTKLFFGTAQQPEPEPKDSLVKEEKAVLDVWNWQDAELQPEQKVNLDKEKKHTYLAVLHLAGNEFVQLADPLIREIKLNNKRNGEYALGKDENPYKRASSWSGKWHADYYLVDVKTGIKRQMIANMPDAWLSPGGKFVVWYNPADSSYYSRSTNIESKEINELTKQIPVHFFDELNDVPNDPSPYGIVGWAKDDRNIYIYDRYDIWKIDPTAMKVPVNVTRSFGRRNQMRLRYIKLDPEEEFIDIEGANIIKSFDERSKDGGFFTIDFKNFREPRMLIAENKKFGTPRKAKNHDQLLFTKQNCEEFPDLWTCNLKFDRPKKISEANPQQKDYNWATVRLVKWTAFTGEELEGLLYLPENFDPRLNYPVVVYFYERNSDNLHNHSIPSPSRSIINKTFYPSNGYIVFVPDITYRDGYPGQSAYDAIVSGTNYLINQYQFIDQEKIALQGQSWGGYQTAYLVTQTDMFAAAMAGAPVSNMTSAYGGIRWQTGLSRMFQYEHSQSRIGATLWEKPLHYIENSPLFYAPKVNTPLLMMHNDKDGAVPWYQGIEFFVALRRLDKPVWLLSYNNEPHNLKRESWGNRMDLTKRMKGFFDHYLKDHAMPVWMKYGIPAKDKGKKFGY